MQEIKKTTKTMKKIILSTLIILFSISLFSQEIGKGVWKQKYAWEEGMTNAIGFQTYAKKPKSTAEKNYKKTKSFLITANSNKGVIKIFKIDKETGAIGKIVSEKKGLKTGKWAITTFKYSGSGKYYLFISHSDYGIAEVYKLSKKGKIKSQKWKTETFEKGINVALSTNDGHLFLMKPDAGWAWTFKENIDGTVGKQVWHTKNWVKNIAAAANFDNDKIGLVKPNGKAWAFKVHNGALEYIWETNKYNKDISVAAYNSTPYKGLIIGSPIQGKEWVLKFGYKNKISKVKKFLNKFVKSVKYKNKYVNLSVEWQDHNWEKGVTIQTIINGGKHLFVAKPKNGAAWVFELK